VNWNDIGLRGEKMNFEKRLTPIDAAQAFISEHFPTCQAAILAGSVVRGEATKTSDLDIVIFDERVPSSYRESFEQHGWPIEVFVHNFHSYKKFYKMDCESGTPSMPKMVAEGICLKGEEFISPLKEEAKLILENGPEAWTEGEIDSKRYFLTDTLDDFIGSEKREEEIFIAGALADMLSEFILRTKGHWVGKSKWLFRSLKQLDEEVAQEFTQAFDYFYRTGKKEKIIDLVDEALEPYGGRYFAGFSIGKEQLK